MILSDDLLVDIFHLLDDHSIDQKFQISQVCASWRALALSASTLWTRIAVMTPLDAWRLPIVLKRSGNQLLDVELRWQYRYQMVLISNDEQAAVSANLIQHLQRIKRLFVTYQRDRKDGLHGILASQLEFPALEDLEVVGAYDETFVISLTAPRLRRLSLDGQHITRWSGLLPPSLVHFHARNCYRDVTTEFLHRVFELCPAVEHVYLDTSDESFTEFSAPVALALRSLYLRTEPVNITSVLRSGFPNRTLFSITTSTINGDVDDEMKDMLAEVLRGLDSVRSLIIHYDQDIEVIDAVGRSRRMQNWNEDSTWEWPAFWLELVKHTAAHKTLQTISIDATYWTVLASAFKACAPAMESLELRVGLDGDSVEETVYSFRENDYEKHVVMHRLNCTPLHRLVFFDSKYYSDVSRLTVVRKLLQSIDCPSQSVEVCLSGAGIESSELATLIEELAQLGVWKICAHCASVCV